MKAPKCRLCGVAHWSYQPHAFKGMEPTDEDPLTWPMEKETVTESETVTRRGGRGKRVYGTNAERQAAYRGRHGP